MSEPVRPLRELFLEAREIADPERRNQFLAQVCAGDPALRRELEELLSAEARSGQFLPDNPPESPERAALLSVAGEFGQDTAELAGVQAEKPGDRIGRFELLVKIGEGGCGVVYLAQQEAPVRRQVALKVIKLGMDTRQVMARFKAEQQALAMMDHPNIARVFDAGATDAGRPFFAMELVRGARITEYCTRHHLSIRQRLELFIQVCQAVQHAHQKGIIHRDLKPSNILVAVHDEPAVPKVIDFGIAKAVQGKLTDQTLLTGFEQFLGTPAYMSPEQAAMSSVDIDTRTDVYSLGVLLYELLTGHTPFDTKELMALGVDELRRTIREKDPVRPSTRLRQSRQAELPAPHFTPRLSIATDLDWIVMKCLEKDRAQRYETVSGLATDLRRHLNHETVSARPPSRIDELRKTVRRHKVEFVAATAVLVALVAGVIVSTRQAVRATRAEKEQLRLRQENQAEAYTARMSLALQKWEEGHLNQAQSLLKEQLVDSYGKGLRGFEWRYLWNLCRDESLHTVQIGWNDPVRQLAATPAHRFVAAACEKTVRLFDPSSFREILRFPYPNSATNTPWPLLALASGKTNLLVAHGAGGVIAFWDLATQRLMMQFKAFTNSVGALALSTDGQLLAAADRELFYGTSVTVWEISSLTEPPRVLRSYPIDRAVTALSFKPNGKILAAARSSEQEVFVSSWDLATGEELSSIPRVGNANTHAIAFSPDGELLATAGPSVSVWNFATRTRRFLFEDHSSVVVLLCFSADGTHLFSGSDDQTIRRWDLHIGKQDAMWRLPHGQDVRMVLSPDERTIASMTRDEIQFWTASPRPPAAIMNIWEGWGWLIVSPDGKWLIASDPDDTGESPSAGVWDLASGQYQFELVTKGLRSQSLAFSPDGRFFALGGVGKEGLVALWETMSWSNGVARVEPFRYLTNGFESGSVRFSPDGKILAVAGLCFPPYVPREPSGATNRLAFWEVGSWNKQNLLPQAGLGLTEREAAATADFSPDGRWLAVGSRDGWVRIWDRKQEKPVKEFNGHKEFVQWGICVTFSSNSRWLASFNRGGPSLILYDLADMENSQAISLSFEESGGLMGTLFTADNQTLITASDDGLIKFWNLRTRKVALTLRHGHGPSGCIALTPDGNTLVSKDATGLVKRWRAPSLEEIDKKEAP